MKVPRITSSVLATCCLVLTAALPGCEDYSLGPLDLSDCGDLCEPPPEVRSVVIVPDSITLFVGQKDTIRAIVTMVDGSVLKTSGVAFWSSDTTVATVAPTEIPPGRTQEVIGRAVGGASITANFRGKSGWAKVIVIDDP